MDEPIGQDSGGESAVRWGLEDLPVLGVGTHRELQPRRSLQRLPLERISVTGRLGAGASVGRDGMEEWRLEMESNIRSRRPTALRTSQVEGAGRGRRRSVLTPDPAVVEAAPLGREGETALAVG